MQIRKKHRNAISTLIEKYKYFIGEIVDNKV